MGQGGEGIVLKERTSLYRPGMRSPAWLKLKPKLTLEVVVTGGSAERVRWGDWGEAVMLAFRYTHPRTGADVEIRQARARAAGSPVRPHDRRAPRAGVLGRDAERDAAASGGDHHQVGCSRAPPRSRHFHDTRHHFASWYVMRGGALPALQQILGHATLAMTMRYAHLSPKHLREEMAKTERQAEPQTEHRAESAEGITQEITHESVPDEGVIQN